MEKFILRGVEVWYNGFQALKDINMDIEANRITAFIGPSGCGKSTLIRCLNRMNDLVEGCKVMGRILLDGVDINGGGGGNGGGNGGGGGNVVGDAHLGVPLASGGGNGGGNGGGGPIDLNMLRKRVGMVFQKPNPFPMSVYDNIAFGPRTHGIRSKRALDDIIEKSLRDAAIWDEVKDRLKKSAMGLSGGQQQRLCIARALSVSPEALLMDEPTSALDPISTAKIEDLVSVLKRNYTVVIVTHNMQQAARISDKTAFFLLGEMVEYGETDRVFSMPRDKRCEDYITGRFG